MEGRDVSGTLAACHTRPRAGRGRITALHCEGEDLEIPAPSSMDELRDNPDYEGGQWGFGDVDPGALDTRKEHINLSVPAYMKMSSHAVLAESNQSAFVIHLDS